jgi:hypothetical protein
VTKDTDSGADFRRELARLDRSLERMEALERSNADLKRRLTLVELYLDTDRREREGVTLDQVREAWRGKRPVPQFGAL